MPANYTFHRFGADALRRLPGSVQQPIQRFRRLYNAGLHGTDLFFYFRPMGSASVGNIRGSFAGMTGEEFFSAAAQNLKKNPSEGAAACLYGLLARYCLKSQLAPLFRKALQNEEFHQVELEVELDRYLLGLDGKTPAHQQDISSLLTMTQGECVTFAAFFPAATSANVLTAQKKMVRWTRRLAAKKRWFAKLLLAFTRRDFRHQMMPDHANHKCMHLDKPMLECYERAMEMYPEMLQRLNLFLKNGTPLGEDFACVIE